MRIVVASARSPFADPAPLCAADELARALRDAGHQAEQIWLALDPDPGRAVQRQLMVQLTDVSDAGDVMITLRSPSHLLRHPAKVVWFDGDTDDGTSADRVAVSEARRVFAASATAARRLRAATGIEAPVLAPDRLHTDPAQVVAELLE